MPAPGWLLRSFCGRECRFGSQSTSFAHGIAVYCLESFGNTSSDMGTALRCNAGREFDGVECSLGCTCWISPSEAVCEGVLVRERACCCATPRSCVRNRPSLQWTEDEVHVLFAVTNEVHIYDGLTVDLKHPLQKLYSDVRPSHRLSYVLYSLWFREWLHARWRRGALVQNSVWRFSSPRKRYFGIL